MKNVHSITERLRKLESRPASMVPHFVIEYSDGRCMDWRGMDILSFCAKEDVRRIHFDPLHQPSVDGVGLLEALYPQIEFLPTF